MFQFSENPHTVVNAKTQSNTDQPENAVHIIMDDSPYSVKEGDKDKIKNNHTDITTSVLFRADMTKNLEVNDFPIRNLP